jgi:type II secretory pathway component GspD/PulD (secretin)
MNPLMSYSYRDIGTNIDVTASAAADGGYRVQVTLEESSVYPSSDGAKGDSPVAGVPSFRSFRATNNLNMKDGQVIEFTAATDRINGEITRISVKLTVLK